MERNNRIVKEFYAQYGLAMHHAHILEKGLLELYAIKKYVDEKLTKSQYFKILSNKKEKLTLGKLNEKLIKLDFLDTTLISNLKTANEYRIFLAHQFWWEKNIDFDNHNELIDLQKEIFTYINHFESIITSIDQIIIKIKTENNLNIEAEMGLTDFHERELYIKKHHCPIKIKNS